MLERFRHLFNRIVVFLQYCVFSRLAKLPQLQSDISTRCDRFFPFKSAMSTGNVDTGKEPCFFRLAKCVVDYSSAALTKVFKREWNKLYPNSRWRGNRRSGLQLVRKEIRSSSRLYLPSYNAHYKRIKDNLEGGNTDDWDVTALFFVLKFSRKLLHLFVTALVGRRSTMLFIKLRKSRTRCCPTYRRHPFPDTSLKEMSIF